ncbi:hypothetical protein GH714_002094 [Hevea brasiliensis]|uniref:Uncharacterized protein n=1 Tax=Hevea brasiliensis TaxID=3981 RepID=A0A6A6MLB2_HEVBR|nr:hypothetical protein GH714_002094 [Hevea brasiliensis]
MEMKCQHCLQPGHNKIARPVLDQPPTKKPPKARKGFGVFVSEANGSIYTRMPGETSVNIVHGQSSIAAAARGVQTRKQGQSSHPIGSQAPLTPIASQDLNNASEDLNNAAAATNRVKLPLGDPNSRNQLQNH